MKLNKYTWELYKQSEKWKEASALFDPGNLAENEYRVSRMFNQYDFSWLNEDEFNDQMESLYAYSVSENQQPCSLQESRKVYESIISHGLYIEQEEIIPRGDYKTMLGCVPMLSFLCYFHAPEYFFPYIFRYNAFELNQIADTFGIQMPLLPKKSDYKARCMYYGDLCEVFYRFRRENGLSPVELCAFLYDFAPAYIKSNLKTDVVIPPPAQAWCIGGFIAKIDKDTGKQIWQGSPETKKGDILIHYETSPVSAITRLWISQTDGVIDPFFYYYANIYLGNEIEVAPITLKELRGDHYFSTHPLIRKSFQGVNGWKFTAEDYTNFLRMLQAKGENTQSLPQLYAPALVQSPNVKKERDVETMLLEPLLKEIGLPKEGTDFVRQIPIQSGRGTSIFPDYVIGYNENKRKCSAIIEVKYHMKSSKELSDAFNQASSYALLLQASFMILCDKECLIVYDNKEGFDRNRGVRYYWEEVSNPDKFNELKAIIKQH